MMMTSVVVVVAMEQLILSLFYNVNVEMVLEQEWSSLKEHRMTNIGIDFTDAEMECECQDSTGTRMVWLEGTWNDRCIDLEMECEWQDSTGTRMV